MREQTWNDREPNSEHYQWFRNLLQLHSLTQIWLGQLKSEEKDGHQLRRVLAPGVQESLRILEDITQASVPSSLSDLLDDSYPEELLGRLEQTVWVVQAWSLNRIFEKTPKTEWPALKNSLQQSSWKSGRACARDRWPGYPREAIEDLRGVFAGVSDSALSGYPHGEPYLIRRSVSDEIQLELIYCPHTVPHIQTHPAADELCNLHVHWLRGFTYAINPRVMIDYHPGRHHAGDEIPTRCRLRWYFIQN